MSAFERFGVTPDLVGSVDAYQALATAEARVEAERIAAAVKYLIPSDSGHDLIRIGGHGDGGYLVPDDLDGIEACFSPGTNNFKNFEDHLSHSYGIKAFMCDYTSSVERLRTPLVPGMQFFEKKWLDVSGADDALELNQWVRSAGDSGRDLILQMDIEGAEYRNLLHASEETLRRFRIIVIELHALQLLSDHCFLNGIFQPLMEKLSRLFLCVHAHPNNCCPVAEFGPDIRVPRVMEMTFLRRDRVRSSSRQVVLPHPLDEANVRGKDPVYLDGIWLGNADQQASDLARLRNRVAWFEARMRQVADRVDRRFYLQLLNEYTSSKTNVARDKLATQSSQQPVRRGKSSNNTKQRGKLGFQTDVENDPWWQLDLETPCELSAILLFNRPDAGSNRVKRLKILSSLDGETWTLVYDHNGRAAFGGADPLDGVPALFVVPEGPGAQARFIKLTVPGRTALALDDVEIYGAPLQV